MRLFFALSLSLLISLCRAQDLSVFDITFEYSMGTNNLPRKESTFFTQLKNSYNENHFLKVLKNKTKKFKGIPKIIHQIWIGPNKLPSDFLPFIESWKKAHPDWEYKIWTNSDLESFHPFSGQTINKAENIGCKVDIFKYEILYRYGGVYIDIDFECLKPLDIIVENTQFFAAIYEKTTIGQGIVGATKNHPLLKKMVQHFKRCENVVLSKPIKDTGPRYFTTEIQNYFSLPNHEPLLIFPVSFFHSFPRSKRVQYWDENASSEEIIKSFAQPETFGMHYWGHTWAE